MSTRHVTLLNLEALEQRECPALFLWKKSIFSQNDNWNNPQNWSIYDDFFQRYLPSITSFLGKDGPGDEAKFTDEDNTDVIVNVPNLSLDSLIAKNYTGTIILSASIAISGDQGSVMIFDAPMATVSGFTNALGQVQRGQLTVETGAIRWKNGTFSHVDIDVKKQSRSAQFVLEANAPGASSRSMVSTNLTVSGVLDWSSGNTSVVHNNGAPVSQININPGGLFSIRLSDSYIWGGTQANHFTINNAGTLKVWSDAPNLATIVGNYTTTGATNISGGSLAIVGVAEQTGSGIFSMTNGGKILTQNAASTLNIRSGVLKGTGTIEGNLVLGYAAQDNMPLTKPILSPGGGVDIGVINVTGNFHMFSGQLDIEVVGMSENQFDRVNVSGYTAFTAGPFGAARDLVINLLPVHWGIFPLPPLWQFPKLPFLTYGQPRQGDFANKYYNADLFIVGTDEGPNDNPKKYWVQPKAALPATNGNIRGMAWRDNGAVPGVFEAGVETLLTGHGVRLFDGTGTFQLMYTTTNASGNYAFDGYEPGYYVVRFDRPTGQRFAPQDVGLNDALDSDVDSTGTVAVALFQDHLYTSAGLYANSPPVVPPVVLPPVYRNKPISGDLSTGVTDPDGDNPKFRVGTGPSHGTVTIDLKGRFTYTPATNYTGSDSFTFVADDGYDGLTTATVSVNVLPGATIAGRIWDDANRNGTQDPGEGGLAGVQVQLLDANFNVVAVTFTDSFGSYTFEDVPAGQFRLRVLPPTDATFAPKDTGDDALDSDFDEFGYGDLITTTSGSSYDFDAALWLAPNHDPPTP